MRLNRWLSDADLVTIIVVAAVFAACGAMAGAQVMKRIVMFQAELAGCQVVEP
jgi:hypothetical protein